MRKDRKSMRICVLPPEIDSVEVPMGYNLVKHQVRKTSLLGKVLKRSGVGSLRKIAQDLACG